MSQDTDNPENEYDWDDNPTIMVSSSNKIKREVSECDGLTEDGYQLLQNIYPLNRTRYEIVSTIAEGGGGVIYEFYDKNTSRRVAIKSLHEQSDSDKERLAFIKEALVTANLEHPSIIPIYEIVQDSNGKPMYAMKKLNGIPLSRILSGFIRGDQEIIKNYSLTKLLQIFLKICDATSYAHAQNVLHLDIKPENIMIGEFGDVLLMDWGLAEHMGTTYTSDTTQSIFENFIDNKYDNYIHGTPGYMAPEQIIEGPESFDQRTDIHGLGGLLYSMLTCRRPYRGIKQSEIITNTVNGELPTPQEYAPHKKIPDELSAIVMKAMAQEKGDRYTTVAELHDDIDNFLLGNAVTALKETVFKKLLRIYLRHFTTINYSLITLFFISLLISLLTVYHLKTKGNWKAELDLDLNDYNTIATQLYVQDPITFALSKIQKDSVDSEGFAPGSNWLFLGQPGELDDYVGDVKIELDFEWSSYNSIDALEICFNSVITKKSQYEEVPTGYSVQIASWLRQFNYISINRKDGRPSFLNSTQFHTPTSLRNRITIEKKHKNIKVFWNDKQILSQRDPAYFAGRPYGNIRLRCWDSRARFKRLSVYTQKRPQLASLLDVGDSHVVHRTFKAAMFEYMKVIRDYSATLLRDEAGKRYLQTAYTRFNTKEINNHQLASELDKLRSIYWSDELDSYNTSQRIIKLWCDNDFNEALQTIEQEDSIEKKIYYTNLLLREKHVPLPDESLVKRFLNLIALDKTRQSLDIGNYGISDLTPIKEIPLAILFCRNNNISDLSPLKEMPLTSINLSYNNISNIDALRDHKLKLLIIGDNDIEGPITLTHKTLEVYFSGNTPIASTDFLKGHPLYVVGLQSSPVSSIESLRGCMTLRRIGMDHTNVTDFSPLKDIPLRAMRSGGSFTRQKRHVKNVSDIRTDYLDQFILTNTDITEIPDFKSANKLRYLDLSRNKIANLKPLNVLKKYNTLKKLNLSMNPIRDASVLTSLSLNRLGINSTQLTDMNFLSELKIKEFPSFYNKHMTTKSLEKIYKNWEENHYPELFLEYVEVMILTINNDYKALKERAVKIGKNRYINIQVSMSYKKAKEFAEKCGGHLVCFETHNEYVNVISSPHFKGITATFFLGLENHEKSSDKIWLTGKKLDWTFLPFSGIHRAKRDNPLVTNYYVRYNNRFNNSVKRDLPFIIEFESEK